MACRLFNVTALIEPMLTYHKLDPNKQTPVKFGSNFVLKESIWKRRM